MISLVFMSTALLNCGKVFKAEAMTLSKNGVTVNFLSFVEYRLRSLSSSVISALSNCVTCGMAAQAKVKCSAVLRRILFMALRSISPHLEKSGKGCCAMPLPARATAPVFKALAKAFTSCMEMRPLGPEPGTWEMSMPISRAKARTDGAAGTSLSGFAGWAAAEVGAADRGAAGVEAGFAEKVADVSSCLAG